MADVKITALTAISSNPVNPATFPIPMVDLLDNTITASGTTKKVTVNQILGAGGTATLASATITGAATVGTTLGVTGDLTASSDVLVNGSEKYVYLSSNYTIGNNSRVRFRAVGAGGGSGYGGDFRISTRASNNTWNTDVLTIDSTGNVNVAAGNVVMGTSGTGIDFSATPGGAGTVTSELLNDYEEGTFLPTLTGATTQPATLITGTGRYTKIGRVVTVQITFTNVSTVGYSGLVGITGLPFTNNASVASVGGVTSYDLSTFTGSPFASLSPSDSFLNFYANVSGTGFSNVNHSAGTARYSIVSITYTVA